MIVTIVFINIILFLMLTVIPKFIFPYLGKKFKEEEDKKFAKNCRIYKERFLFEQESTRIKNLLSSKILFEERNKKEFCEKSSLKVIKAQLSFDLQKN